jgi:hypothetical protein
MSDKMHPVLCPKLMRRRFLVSLSAILASVIFFASNPRTQTRAGEPTTSAAPVKAADKPVAEKQRPNERHVKAYILLAALAGIVIAGVGLTALIILWAGRLRRQFRRPMPECDAPERDFWFLKPPKPTVRDSMLPDSHLPQHDAPPNHDGESNEPPS